MIMGLGGTMDDWPPEVIAELSREYQLILLDNRGMGFTTGDSQPFNYRLFADDVVGLLDALGVERANVLGFSMGSAITEELLTAHPQRFEKAILYAPTTDATNMISALTNINLKDEIVARQIEAAKLWKAPLNKLAAITNQVMLLVETATNKLARVEKTDEMAPAIPGVWLIQFKKGKRHLMNQEPAEFATLVSNFLDMNETIGTR